MIKFFKLYFSFVLYVNGEWIVTDITANDGSWHSVCVMWHSANGEWSIYIDGKLGDNGTGLASGTFIPGKEGTLRISNRNDDDDDDDCCCIKLFQIL
jgi:CUB/sushi domain-containing protein